MENEKGITLTVLVVTVIILSITISSITYYSLDSFRLKKYNEMCADIEILDDKIAMYYLENGDLPVKSESMNITDLVENYCEESVNYNPNNSGILYKIDLEKLENINLNFKDYYIDLESHTIYSKNSVKLDEIIYYTVPVDYEEVKI